MYVDACVKLRCSDTDWKHSICGLSLLTAWLQGTLRFLCWPYCCIRPGSSWLRGSPVYCRVYDRRSGLSIGPLSSPAVQFLGVLWHCRISPAGKTCPALRWLLHTRCLEVDCFLEDSLELFLSCPGSDRINFLHLRFEACLLGFWEPDDSFHLVGAFIVLLSLAFTCTFCLSVQKLPAHSVQE